ncbi:MAG TPA: DUF3352 domain-containing protein [Candidatus Limnocylindrales bacterium]
MTEPIRPDEQTTIEEIPTPSWDATAPVSNATADPGGANAGARAAGTVPSRGRGRAGLRWLVAILGVVVVIGASAVVVSLAAGRPTPSIAMGYMPADTGTYSEARLDLPGDQRQKLGSFLAHAVPGFDDQSQLDTKLNDVLDRITRAATNDKQAWTTDIAPWFGGQVAIGMRLPDGKATGAASTSTPGMGGAADGLAVVTISDRTRAITWLQSLGKEITANHTTYNGADLYRAADSATNGSAAIAVTDKVILAGLETTVKAAVDTNGKSGFAENEDVKAALASIEQENVGFSLIRTKAYVQGAVDMLGSLHGQGLDPTKIGETVVGMLPAWQTSSLRFENDALAVASTSPAWNIGYETANRKSALLGHTPANTVLYGEVHDVGQGLDALLAKFRALPEAKPAFDAVDQALALLGGKEGVYGWWGDVALAVSPVGDDTIGGGILIQPKDPEAARRFMTTLTADLQLAGASTGIAIRTEDHNGTKVTVADFSAVAGAGAKDLPPGYKAEIAWAANDSVAVIGYGRDFVNAVLDAGPGNSLGDDARFQGLLGRVGAENISLGYLDVAGIRTLVEPLLRAEATPEKWAEYEKEYKPYLDHYDALIGAVRKDGSLDRGSVQLTVR